MQLKTILATTVLAMCVSGCATLVEGTTQDIAINVTPVRAECAAYVNGLAVGTYNPSTSLMRVSKSRHNMTVTCMASGYRPRSVVLISRPSGVAIAGAVLIDFGLVDYATGALNKYEDALTIVLEPLT